MRLTSPRGAIQQRTVDSRVTQDAGLCVSLRIRELENLRYDTFDVVLELNVCPSKIDIPCVVILVSNLRVHRSLRTARSFYTGIND